MQSPHRYSNWGPLNLKATPLKLSYVSLIEGRVQFPFKYDSPFHETEILRSVLTAQILFMEVFCVRPNKYSQLRPLLISYVESLLKFMCTLSMKRSTSKRSTMVNSCACIYMMDLSSLATMPKGIAIWQPCLY